MFFNKTFKINYHTNGANEKIDSIECKYKTVFPELPKLSKDGYKFGGWFLNQELNEEFNLEKMPKHDVDLYAKWDAITLDEFIKEINFFSKTANILKNLQNDYTDVPDFRDVSDKEKEPSPKKKATKSTKKKTTKKTTKKKTKSKSTKAKVVKEEKEPESEELIDVIEEDAEVNEAEVVEENVDDNSGE